MTELLTQPMPAAEAAIPHAATERMVRLEGSYRIDVGQPLAGPFADRLHEELGIHAPIVASIYSGSSHETSDAGAQQFVLFDTRGAQEKVGYPLILATVPTRWDADRKPALMGLAPGNTIEIGRSHAFDGRRLPNKVSREQFRLSYDPESNTALFTSLLHNTPDRPAQSVNWVTANGEMLSN